MIIQFIREKIMPKLITVTDIVRSFSDIVGRVYYKGESYDIKKGNNIVARLSPVKARTSIDVANLNSFFKDGPHLSKEDTEEFDNILKESRNLKDDGGAAKWE